MGELFLFFPTQLYVFLILIQLTLEQHGFELHGSTSTRIFFTKYVL